HLQTLLQHFHQVDPAQIQDSLARLEDVDSMHMESQKIYPFSLYDDEKTIAEKIQQHNFPIETVPPEDLTDAIRDVEFDNAIEYDIHQKEAIETFFAHSMMIINGGPGTGKTTIIKGILKMCETFYPTANIQLCAPTGRATNRMSQLSSYNARTIHSLLKWNMEDNSFGANEQEPLDCDFLVVDECSMVDTHLFASLLKALPIHCRIILIGDEDQLESVGPGKVFQDLLDADICPAIHLEKIYRQKEGSGIVQMAQQIRLEQPLTYTNGVTFMQQESNTIAQTILNLAQYQDMDDCQILAPMYKGIAGIDLINTEMQKVLNPPSQGKAEIRIGTTVFRVQDKVMLLKNMPEQDVYNGDIGTLLEIEKEKNEIRLIVDFDGHLVEITHDILYYLKHAYCISIHKSQGSEYDRVICIVDPSATGMYNKRLLYTAVSRAKKDLVLIGNRALFENSVRLKQRHIRQTTLISMIHQNRQE
ncbi:MAG: AAA family ATPase, partial [Erysipelotrichaceae bacterium]|nr:AAA family ATPase [Erysipelotrichaceae bacterium]